MKSDIKKELKTSVSKWNKEPESRFEILSDVLLTLIAYTVEGVANRSPAEALDRLKTTDRLFAEWSQRLTPLTYDGEIMYVGGEMYRQVLAQECNSDSLAVVFKSLGWDWLQSVAPHENENLKVIELSI